ncbi:transposase [Sorangium sp. So ce1128]
MAASRASSAERRFSLSALMRLRVEFWAVHVLDRCHVAQLLSKTVDTLRRNDVHALRKAGQQAVLTKTRWILLKNRTKPAPSAFRRREHPARARPGETHAPALCTPVGLWLSPAERAWRHRQWTPACRGCAGDVEAEA